MKNFILLILMLGITSSAFSDKSRPISKYQPQSKQIRLNPIKLKRSSGKDSEFDRYCDPGDPYLKLYTPGKSWIYKFFDPAKSDNPVYFSQFTVDGDTIINQYFVFRLRIDDPTKINDTQRFVFVKEVGAIAYRCLIDNSIKDNIEPTEFSFIPIYNFNLEEGNRVKKSNLEVIKTFNLEVREIERKCLEIGNPNTGIIDGYWIEGIGATNPLNTITEFPDIIEKGYVGKLISCYDGEECIYDEADFDLLISAGITEPIISESNNLYYYNLQGQRVNNPVKGQLYIRHDGNKVSKVIY